MSKIISFPHLGPYYIPVKYIIEKTTKCQIIVPPENNNETISLGSRYSPDDICMPFKYNLGNYLHALQIDKIDILFITHYDEDHCGNIDDLKKDFSIFQRQISTYIIIHIFK